jgi:DNA polymerase III epsilon subunit-like protein
MRLPTIPLVVLDTETTGFVPRVHRVIEFASIVCRDGKMESEYEQLLTTDEVPPVVQVLTRIKTVDLTDKPSFADKKDEILRAIPDDALIVGQNIPFDIGMLKGEGIDLSNRPWIDTSMLASLVFPELDSYSLGYLSRVLKLNHDPPHRALGDVRATLELLSKCWERLLELPKELRDVTDAVMQKAPEGYKQLFAALPPATSIKDPAWLRWKEDAAPGKPGTPLPLAQPSKKNPTLVEETLSPLHLQEIIEGALEDKKRRHWIAVKNLRAVTGRLPEALLKKLRVLHPPYLLIDAKAVERLSAQSSFTTDEATLALKIAWYEPTRRDLAPIHGGEDAVWNGKLGSTQNSAAFLEQLKDLPNVILLEHRDLLQALADPSHPAWNALIESDLPVHVVIDDASMLEDTATKAFGWFCAADDIRAAAEGNANLTKLTDTMQLWIEKVRQFQEIRYLSPSDLSSIESKGLRKLLDEALSNELPAQLKRHLESFRKILEPENMSHRIAYIEQRPNGSQIIQSVPERIGQTLMDTLFSQFPTTLLIPQGCGQMLPEILPAGKGIPTGQEAPDVSIPTMYSADRPFESFFESPLTGKTIMLLPGKGAIEDLYVKYAEALEKKNVTLVCQGVGGGMGRMRAEFLAADAPAIWLITPWMFEGVDLPPETVTHLVFKTLPFDHPSHPILSRRANHYQDAFSQYSLPRLLHRLFRLLRTYERSRAKNGDLYVLDERLKTKSYGATVRQYLEQFAMDGTPEVPAPTPHPAPFTVAPVYQEEPEKKKSAPLRQSSGQVKKKKPAGSKDQPSLF